MVWLLVEWGGYRMKKRAVRREKNFVPVTELSAVLRKELPAEPVCEQDDLFLYRVAYDSSCENRMGNTLAEVLEFFEANRQSRFDFSMLLWEEEGRGSAPLTVIDRLKNRLFLQKERNTLFIDTEVSFPYEDFFLGHYDNSFFVVDKGENGWLLHGSLDSDFRAFNRELEDLFSEWQESGSASAIEVFGGFPFLMRNWIREHWEMSYEIRICRPGVPLKKGRRKTLFLISAYTEEEVQSAYRFLREEEIDSKREIPVIIHAGNRSLLPDASVLPIQAVFADPSRWERDLIRLFSVVISVKDFLEISQIPKLLKQLDEFPAGKSDFCVKTALLFGFWNLDPEDKADFSAFGSALNREIIEKKEEFFDHLNHLIFKMFGAGEIHYPEAYASYLLKQKDDPERFYKILIVIQTLLQNLRITESDIVLDLLNDCSADLPDGSERTLLDEMILLGRFHRARTAYDIPSVLSCGEKILKLPASSGSLKIDFERQAATAIFHYMFYRMEESVNVSKEVLFRVNEISDSDKIRYKLLGNFLIASSMFGMQKLYEGSCYLNFLFDTEPTEGAHTVYYVQAQLLRAASLYVSGQFRELERFFSEPSDLYTDSLFRNRFFYRFLQSRFYFDLGRYGQAEEILLDLMRDCASAKISDPEQTIAVLQAWVGRIYIYSGRKEKAKRCFAALSRLSADACFFQAEGALWEGRIDDALKFIASARKNLIPFSTQTVSLMTIKNFPSGFEEIEDHFYFFNSRRSFLLQYIDFLDNLLRAIKKEEGALLKLSKFIRMQFIQKPEPNFLFFIYTNTLALHFFAKDNGDEINEDTLSTKIQLLFYEKKFFVPGVSVCQEFLTGNFWTRFLKIDGNKFQ